MKAPEDRPEVEVFVGSALRAGSLFPAVAAVAAFDNSANASRVGISLETRMTAPKPRGLFLAGIERVAGAFARYRRNFGEEGRGVI